MSCRASVDPLIRQEQQAHRPRGDAAAGLDSRARPGAGLALFLDTNLAVIGAQAHANAAPDEVKELAGELRVITRRARLPCPASDILSGEVDNQFERASRPPPAAARAA